MPEEQLRSIFKRLNQNVVALNRQELRHSTYWGEFIRCVEGLADSDYWLGTGIFTANDYRRMLDVEYISELVVAVLHGPQNKKQSLDDWYQAYEAEFEQRAEIETDFAAVTGELSHLLPDLKRTRWKNRSDFYTLFTVLHAERSRFPLDSDGRQNLRVALIDFGEAVSRSLSTKPTKGPKATKAVRVYAEAVQRAATDRANRAARARELGRVVTRSLD
jgi:hypothetical protein